MDMVACPRSSWDEDAVGRSVGFLVEQAQACPAGEFDLTGPRVSEGLHPLTVPTMDLHPTPTFGRCRSVRANGTFLAKSPSKI